MLSIPQETYEERMTRYMKTEEYAQLPEAEQARITKNVLIYRFEQIELLLQRIDEAMHSYSSEKQSLQQQLEHTEDRDTQCNLDKVNAALAQLEGLNAEIGLMVIKNTPIWSQCFNDDDLCSLFSVSHADMQKLRREHDGDKDFVGHLVLHAWASDTADLFGRAMMDAISANPQGSKMLHEGLERFMDAL